MFDRFFIYIWVALFFRILSLKSLWYQMSWTFYQFLVAPFCLYVYYVFAAKLAIGQLCFFFYLFLWYCSWVLFTQPVNNTRWVLYLSNLSSFCLFFCLWVFAFFFFFFFIWVQKQPNSFSSPHFLLHIEQASNTHCRIPSSRELVQTQQHSCSTHIWHKDSKKALKLWRFMAYWAIVPIWHVKLII